MSQASNESVGTVSSKERLVAILLCFFLGVLGAHRFYAGRIPTAVIMLITTVLGWITVFIGIGFILIGITSIWTFIDFIIILVGKFKDTNGYPIVNWIRTVR